MPQIVDATYICVYDFLYLFIAKNFKLVRSNKKIKYFILQGFVCCLNLKRNNFLNKII